jgi:hypothetical protein
MTVAQFRRLRPDVIALQEASIADGRGNVAARIGHELGYYVAQVPATERMFARGLLGWHFGRLAAAVINGLSPLRLRFRRPQRARFGDRSRESRGAERAPTPRGRHHDMAVRSLRRARGARPAATLI